MARSCWRAASRSNPYVSVALLRFIGCDDGPETADRRVVDEPGDVLRLGVVDDGAVAQVRLCGELDLRSRELLDVLLQIDLPATIVVDFHDLGYLDCAALTRLDEVTSELCARGADVRRVNPAGAVKRALNVLQADDGSGADSSVT
jgi:anti-anti-sigma factor